MLKEEVASIDKIEHIESPWTSIYESTWKSLFFLKSMCHTGTSNGGKKWRMVLFKWTHTWNHPEHHRTALLFWFFWALCKPCANHGHARMALVMPGGHCVWLTPISRGRVSHSDSGLNTVGGVLACPWFVNDWHSLRIMPLSNVEKNKLHQSIKLNT